MSAVTVANDPDDLSDLATRINAAHDDATNFFALGIEHAITCGDLLIEAKKQISQHGAWLPWLGANCTVSARTAQVYMQLAKAAPKKFPSNTQHAAHLAKTSMRTALEIVSNKAAIAARPAKTIPRQKSNETAEQKKTVEPDTGGHGIAATAGARSDECALPTRAEAEIAPVPSALRRVEALTWPEAQSKELTADEVARRDAARELLDRLRQVIRRAAAEIDADIICDALIVVHLEVKDGTLLEERTGTPR